MLDLARIESGKIQVSSEEVVVQDVIDEVVTTLRPAAERKGLMMLVGPPTREGIVRTDRRALHQILLNLTNNAIKFTTTGSVCIELVLPVNGRRVDVRVVDTGIGIDLAEQGGLFKAFTQVGDPSGHHEGTGLGLYLSQKLAELIDGSISVSSESGKGSVFTLSLPRQ